MSLISNIIKTLYYAKEYPIFLKQYYQTLYLIRYMRITNLCRTIFYIIRYYAVIVSKISKIVSDILDIISLVLTFKNVLQMVICQYAIFNFCFLSQNTNLLFTVTV